MQFPCSGQTAKTALITFYAQLESEHRQAGCPVPEAAAQLDQAQAHKGKLHAEQCVYSELCIRRVWSLGTMRPICNG